MTTLSSEQKRLFDWLEPFWGKADEEQMLPAIIHMLDVAMVAKAIIDSLPSWERELLLSPFAELEDPVAFVCWLIALHDVGKITPGFQYKLEQRLTFDTLDFQNLQDAEAKHGKSSLGILVRFFDKHIPSLSTASARTLASAVASHHGQFVYSGSYKKMRIDNQRSQWWPQQKRACELLADYFALPDLNSVAIDESKLTPNWLVYCAGLCAVADWIGSNKEDFPYCEQPLLELAKRNEKAQQRVKALGIKQIQCEKGSIDFEQVFGFKPNALQRSVLELISAGNLPKLAIIEAAMGEGKTEAMLLLEDHLIRNGGYNGLYIAMPSQATANQLYNRTLKFFSSEHLSYQDVDSHLIHSNAEFNERYNRLLTESINDDSHRKSANIKADQWFSGRKNGLLANCCVGTVDQLFMAVMLYKHNFVRLFALTNRAIAFDEVHSLDIFQLEIMCTLLEWLAQLNAPVVMLSATLPKAMREQLVQAYQKGLDITKTLCPTAEYPRITFLDNQNQTQAFSVSHKSQDNTENHQSKTYQICLHSTQYAQLIEKMAQDVVSDALAVSQAGGGVLACVVNTVSDVQKLVEKIRVKTDANNAIEVVAFHARYPLAQKLEIEAYIEHRLGKNSTNINEPNPYRPSAGKVLILTGSQVLDQALDYCSCKMYSQILPADMLLQRMGRLWRNPANAKIRSPYFSQPELHLYLPSQDAVEKDMEKAFGFANCQIYPSHLLAVTTRLFWQKAAQNDLPNRLAIHLPEEIDTWIEQVYPSGVEKDGWSEQELDAEFSAALANRMVKSLATEMLFEAEEEDIEELLSVVNSVDDDEPISLTTRLALPSVQLVFLLQDENGHWLPATEVTSFQTRKTAYQWQGEEQEKRHAEKVSKVEPSIDWQKCLAKQTVKRLKQVAVSINRPKWVQHFTKDYPWPQQVNAAKWQKTSALYGTVPVCLNAEFEYQMDADSKLRLDPKLGVVWI